MPASTTAPLRVRISPTAESLIRKGHPWIFDNSIRDQNRAGQDGDLAVIYDRNDRFLAAGFFDSTSPIRIRIVHQGKPIQINKEWWRGRLQTAFEKRRILFEEQTTGYRCINGESDGCPALVVDRYDTTLVVKIYSVIWFKRLEEIFDLLEQLAPSQRIVLRLSRNIEGAARTYHFHDGQIVRGRPLDQAVVFLENGIRFEANVLQGQKTGFFLDQRENRKKVETLSNGKDVLNAFSFSGGFSLYAARGGARSVTDLDISAHALESAKRNYQLNTQNSNVAHCRYHGIQADVFKWLQEEQQDRFDLIILDPPSLAKRESERSDAIKAYEKLAGGGINHLRRGGTLVAASCSAHVSAEEFFGAVRSAARKSGKVFEELFTSQHAADHAATFSEGHYLKCIYLKFS